MKQTLHHIVSSIVNNEKEVAIEENEQETQEAIVSYVIHVAKEYKSPLPNKLNSFMKISIVTLFAEMFAGPFDYSILKKIQEKQLLSIEYINIRDFGIGKHKIVDDKPYGGGVGMILRVDVLEKAISSVRGQRSPI